MAKSQETFSKKEKEKLKLKKRKEKEEKKAERKANSQKGQDLEDMYAYVDENGNLTSVLPDPKKKKIINLEDVNIGVGRQAPAEPEEVLRKGVVTFFNESKGYGFIKDTKNQAGVFVHINGLIDQVKEGDKVSFEIEMNHKGANAIKVRFDVVEKVKPASKEPIAAPVAKVEEIEAPIVNENTEENPTA
jgi:cold shock CspA family protein